MAEKWERVLSPLELRCRAMKQDSTFRNQLSALTQKPDGKDRHHRLSGSCRLFA